ncbi:MAG TPA: class I SAM-dependent methyltransferase, partial [Ilumatobacteraceae bacterium]
MGLRARLFAVAYDAMIARADRAGLGSLRSQLLRRASGDVLEIGAGTGNNLAHYTPAADHITLTEPDPSMLRRLTKRTETWTRSSTVLRAPAENLPCDDATFDTVVSVLVLCGVDDQFLAVREIRRVLRPAGRLLFIEHVRSDDAVLARQQDRCNWISRLTAGCDCNRPTRRT